VSPDIGMPRPGDRLAASGWRRHGTSDPLCSPTLVVGASIFVSATQGAASPECTTRDDGLPARNPRSDNQEFAPLAQSAERLHGKEKVYGSIP
jgi:hypothetical protein